MQKTANCRWAYFLINLSGSPSIMSSPSTYRLTSLCVLSLVTLLLTDAATVPGHIIAWGDNFNGQTTVPLGLDDVIEVAAAYNYSLALRANGTVVGFGSNFSGETTIPPGLTDVVAIAARQFCAALKA